MNTDSNRHKKDDSDLPPPTVNSPINESRFTKFYKTMLILSTIGTSVSVISLTNLPTTINLYATAPINSILGLAGYVVTLVSVLALILLWKKDINGLYLKLGTYAITIPLTISLLFTSGSVLNKATEVAIKDIAREGISISDAHVSMLVSTAFYTAIVLGVASSIVFGILWLLAWKNQARADSEA